MTGEVPVIRVETEVIRKPGEDGHIRRRLGERSPEFTLKTGGSYASKTAARQALTVFSDMIDDTPGNDLGWGLIKDGYNYTNPNAAFVQEYQLAVLDVTQERLKYFSCISGTSNNWWLECNWKLLLIPG
jgi:hypothetical protein